MNLHNFADLNDCFNIGVVGDVILESLHVRNQRPGVCLDGFALKARDGEKCRTGPRRSQLQTALHGHGADGGPQERDR